jgi:hypothetical protein
MASAPLGLAAMMGSEWDEAMIGRLCTDKGTIYVHILLFV